MSLSCKFIKEYNKITKSMEVTDKTYCAKLDRDLTEYEEDRLCDEVFCKHYIKARICMTCKHSRCVNFDNDCIDYYCKVDKNKFIYSSLSVFKNNSLDFPECPCDKWEEY